MDQAMEESAAAVAGGSTTGRLTAYLLPRIELVKPRETALLAVTGAGMAVVAAKGRVDLGLLLLVLAAVLPGSAGANGLTNYLDREVDARMKRTRHRPLPTRRIDPAEASIPFLLALLGFGLTVAWFLNPLCFVVGAVGTMAALIGRKTSVTHPLGVISSVSPAAIGWLAVRGRFDATIILVCLLIALWVPLHVWSVMIANRDDYLQAGVAIFPITVPLGWSVKFLFVTSVCLAATSIAVFYVGWFGPVYLGTAIATGAMAVLAGWRLMRDGGTGDAAWRMYKMSAYPYLGLLFVGMMIDQWVRL